MKEAVFLLAVTVLLRAIYFSMSVIRDQAPKNRELCTVTLLQTDTFALSYTYYREIKP